MIQRDQSYRILVSQIIFVKECRKAIALCKVCSVELCRSSGISLSHIHILFSHIKLFPLMYTCRNRILSSRGHRVSPLAKYSCWHHPFCPLPHHLHHNQQDLQPVWCVGECGPLSLYSLQLHRRCECLCMSSVLAEMLTQYYRY